MSVQREPTKINFPRPKHRNTIKQRLVLYLLVLAAVAAQAQEAASPPGRLNIVRHNVGNPPSAQKTLSDVDVNIPQTKTENNNTYVLIFANETYKYAAGVPFALRDGEVFRQYCEQTLGITAKNHIFVYNHGVSPIISGIMPAMRI